MSHFSDCGVLGQLSHGQSVADSLHCIQSHRCSCKTSLYDPILGLIEPQFQTFTCALWHVAKLLPHLPDPHSPPYRSVSLGAEKSGHPTFTRTLTSAVSSPKLIFTILNFSVKRDYSIMETNICICSY